ncbi:hypothetical protein [Chelativorans sp. M5D2P16]|uniref:hypothetical protein n=1 Tax=Chelativorans sp. M5D2P16 TaxID=3095678 RepID=UPI002ACABCFB|nr:hypothetical protein [Chelativorans sp. M5D2P16]MDZ5697074.1 hypothetical protein [Chelativorans sp. M5D2P16]
MAAVPAVNPGYPAPMPVTAKEVELTIQRLLLLNTCLKAARPLSPLCDAGAQGQFTLAKKAK